MDYYVYAYYEPDSAVPFYIGKGRGDRFKDHLYPSYYLKLNDPFHKKIRAMLRDGFKPDIQIISDGLTDLQARNSEVQLIRKFGRRDLGTGCLFNLTDGGDGAFRPRFSEERKQKVAEFMSKRMLGNQYTKGLVRNTRVAVRSILFGNTIKVYSHISQVKEDGYDPSNIGACLKGRKALAYGLIWEYV